MQVLLQSQLQSIMPQTPTFLARESSVIQRLFGLEFTRYVASALGYRLWTICADRSVETLTV